MHNSLRSAKKEGLLAYSNSKLANALQKLKEIKFLIPQPASKFSLAEDYKENLKDYIEKVTKLE